MPNARDPEENVKMAFTPVLLLVLLQDTLAIFEIAEHEKVLDEKLTSVGKVKDIESPVRSLIPDVIET